MAEIMTEEWASEWCRALNASPAFRAAAASWEGAVLLVVRGVPAHAVFLDLWHGACRAARVARPEDESAARFGLAADAPTWVRVFSGTLDPVAAVMSGSLELTKGSVASLLPYVAAAKELMAVARGLAGSPPATWKTA